MVSYAALKSMGILCVVMFNSLHFSKIWRSAKSWSVVDLPDWNLAKMLIGRVSAG
jgi:hypothetical protein